MSWSEFNDLVAGLNEQTPLVRIAQIRTESDPERLKEYSPEHRAIRAQWQRRNALKRSQEDTDKAITMLQEAFANMFKEQE